MPLDPHDVFRDFAAHVRQFMVPNDADVEDQYFDRKEAPRVPPGQNAVPRNGIDGLREHIRETVSAFANSNRRGGLLVIGIEKTGKVVGINHLTDAQRRDLLNVDQILRGHAAQASMVDCTDDAGQQNRLLLVHAPFSEDAICETIEAHPRAWKRHGAQNLLLNDRDREQLRRDKRIVDFENRHACPYSPSDLDDALLKEIRNTWEHLDGIGLTAEQLLEQLGAVTRTPQGLAFTNAGLLFFAVNPQRQFAAARIRLLRFEGNHTDGDQSLTLEKEFTGNLTKQLRDFRTFIQTSGVFKTYQRRRPDGGFLEEPEFPPIALDEAVVNATAHRDYALTWAVECRYYRDAFVVTNAGTLLQRSDSVPERFALDERRLVSTPRNPKLMKWLHHMRDATGAAFVRELAEGTRRMAADMKALGLPAPLYRVTPSETTVTLLSEPDRRAAETEPARDAPTEYANLYPIQVRTAGQPGITERLDGDARTSLLQALRDRLKHNGWFIDRLSHGILTAHEKGRHARAPQAVSAIVRLFPSYSFASREYEGRSYLAIDYSVEVKNVLSVRDLASDVAADELRDRWASVNVNGWERAKIRRIDGPWVTAHLVDFDRDERVDAKSVIPDLPVAIITRVLEKRGVRFDLHGAIKQESLATEHGAARLRAERTQATAESLASSLFPLKVRGSQVTIVARPLALLREGASGPGLPVRSLPEPVVEFGRHKETSDIRDGITQFGVYDQEHKQIELVPIVHAPMQDAMAALIERLKAGKFKYRGSERTFGTKFHYASIIPMRKPEEAEATCKRLLSEHPAWAGDDKLATLFLVHTPEAGHALDDETSPYYRVKRLLLEAGAPCQMVDTPTLLNPDWKDLNLALNITAKCGVTPWVLPEGIPDADFFVGLSYTQHRGAAGTRLMGYANVFNEYGKWLFFSGNTQTFAYEQRTKKLGELVKATLERLKLQETPHIYFHYSARFSKDDRAAILEAARSVRPKGTYSFVWINRHHPIRLYDGRAEGDGSLERGSYVVSGRHQLYLSTTGNNPYRKSLGTPAMLEVTIWRHAPEGERRAEIDLRGLAVQLLALTKLNWSSTDALTGEPITTKYAGDIAYLTASFLRQGGNFTLHPVLEPTPWFL